jgi:hypothetical protein
MELDEIPNVVGNQRPTLFDGDLKLFLVRQTPSSGTGGAGNVIATILEDFSQKRTDVLIQVQF